MLPAGAVDRPTRASWEQVRVVMSLEDAGRTDLLVGAADDKAADLQEALAETAARPLRAAGRCCWLSVVGDQAALAAHHPRFMARFREHDVTPLGFELDGRRCTYIVPEAARARAAALVYEAFEKV